MKIILIIFTCIVLIIGCENSSESEIIMEGENILKFELAMSDDTLNVDELPKLTATISNISNDEVYLYNDFNYGYYPKILIIINKEESDSSLGCVGAVRSPIVYVLEQKYFVSLYPGQSFELFNNSDDLVSNYSCVFQNKGNYKLFLKLDYSESNLSSWTTKSDYDYSLLRMFNLVPKGCFVSNEIAFTIK